MSELNLRPWLHSLLYSFVSFEHSILLPLEACQCAHHLQMFYGSCRMIKTDTRLSPFSQPWSSFDRFYLNFKNDWTTGRKSHRRWSTLLALLHRNTLSLSGSAGLSENSSKIFLFFRLLPLGPSDLWEATFDPLFSCVLSGLKRSSDPARTTPNYLLVLLFDHPIPPNLYIVISLKHFDDQKEGKIDKKRDRPRVRTAYHEHPAYTVGNGCLESSFFFPFFFARFPSAFLFLAIYIVVKRAETNKRIFIYELLPCHDFFLLISLSLFFFLDCANPAVFLQSTG